MTIELLTAFFKWTSILGIGTLILSAVLLRVLRHPFYRLHKQLFNIDETMIPIIAYCYLGLLKAFIIVFHIIPYIALLILQGN